MKNCHSPAVVQRTTQLWDKPPRGVGKARLVNHYDELAKCLIDPREAQST